MIVLCLGDSHIHLMGNGNLHQSIRGDVPVEMPIDDGHLIVRSVRGATAWGLRKQESSTSSRAICERSIGAYDPDLVCFAFGQVDAEMTAYLTAVGLGIALPDNLPGYFTKIYHQYLETAAEIAQGRQFVVKGINPISLTNQRRTRKYVGTQLRRYFGGPDWCVIECLMNFLPVTLQNHARINLMAAEALQQACLDAGVGYFDIRQETCRDQAPGMASIEFCPRRPDPHLIYSEDIKNALLDKLLSFA